MNPSHTVILPDWTLEDLTFIQIGSGHTVNYKLEFWWIETYALSFYRSQTLLGRSQFFVQEQKLISILCQTKRWFAFSKFNFSADTSNFGVARNAIQFLVWHKIFGPAQNILGPVGQGIKTLECLPILDCSKQGRQIQYWNNLVLKSCEVVLCENLSKFISKGSKSVSIVEISEKR